MGEVVAHLVGDEDAVDDDVEFGAGCQKLFHLGMVQNVLKILKGVIWKKFLKRDFPKVLDIKRNKFL